MNQHKMLTCAGMITIDFLAVVDRFPEENSETRPTASLINIGGPIGRGAVTSSRLGAKTRLLGMVGTGPFASLLRDELAREDIDVHLIVDENTEGSQHSIVVSTAATGSRATFWMPHPKASELCIKMTENAAQESAVILLDCKDYDLTIRAARAAKDSGCVSVLDTGSYKPISEQICGEVDYLIVPEKYVTTRLGGEAVDVTYGVEEVQRTFDPLATVVTCGSGGGYFIRRGWEKALSFQSYPVIAIDSCGAGDVFHGAFAYSLWAGYEFEQALRISAWAAALKCARAGNQGIPDAAMLCRDKPAALVS